jgi:pimeloyl-ACP methyl ester carboxylesterase
MIERTLMDASSLDYPPHMAAPTEPLHVEDSGTGDPVVLLHSSGMSGRQWKRLASALSSRGMRAVVPDLSGHGRSPEWPEPTPFSYLIDVERMTRLLESLGTPAHLVGHSYGGLLSLLVSVRAPTLVRSLVLYDPVAFGVLDPVKDADAGRDLERVPPAWDGTADGRERWLEAFVNYWGEPGAWASLRDDVRAEFRRVGWVVYQEVSTLVKDPTPASAYREIPAPVLLLSGQSSPIAAHRVARRLADSFPHARTVTVEHAGHMGPLTHADVVNRTILDALAPVVG